MSVGTGIPEAPPAPGALDPGLWPAFAAARSEGGFLTAWLTLLLGRLAQGSAAVLLEADAAAGAFVAVAVVPDPRRDLGPFREVAERAIASGRPATLAGTPATEGAAALAGPAQVTRLAFPLRPAPEAPVAAVVVAELRGRDPRAAQAALREMHWAAGWLAARLWQARAEAGDRALAKARIALDLVALAAEQPRPEAAAMAVVNEMQSLLAADRAALGLLEGRASRPRVRLMALSHSAFFRRRSGLAEGLEAAMEECLDQAAPVAHPPLPGRAPAIAVAHADHMAAARMAHVLSVPLMAGNAAVGALTLERRQDRAFTAEELQIAEGVAALIGPAIEEKRRARRWLGGRLADGALQAARVVLGPRHPSWKLLALALAALAVAAATVRGPFRVQADAVLRGTVQRAAVAPFAGYIAEGALRAGDRVQAGQILARLDDSDLRLEELRWRSEMDRLAAQQRSALAEDSRSDVVLIEAQIAQARAQLSLAAAQLARTRLVAPIDGVIVSGDLTQKLGAPVQAGEVLFEIAPLDAYRVDIYIDERDLAHVAAGMGGRLALAGQPSTGLPFVLTRITPQAEAREGANTSRPAPRLDAPPAGLLPGMEGVAKVEAGRARVAWIWTRRLVGWLRATAWAWAP